MKGTLTRFIGILFVALFGSVQAATITGMTDGFESDDLGWEGSSLTNWTLNSGSVDVYGPTSSDNRKILCKDGSGKCIDLVGTANADLETNDSFAAGTYKITFDIAGNGRHVHENTVEVYFGGLLIDTISITGKELDWPNGEYNIFQSMEYTATLSSLGTLRFLSIGGNNNNSGLMLDNVSVSAVPVPAAVWLFGSGLLGLVGYSRRKAV